MVKQIDEKDENNETMNILNVEPSTMATKEDYSQGFAVPAATKSIPQTKKYVLVYPWACSDYIVLFNGFNSCLMTYNILQMLKMREIPF